MYMKELIRYCDIMARSVEITKEENWHVARDTTTGIVSQGKNSNEALCNLKEALDLYYEDILEV